MRNKLLILLSVLAFSAQITVNADENLNVQNITSYSNEVSNPINYVEIDQAAYVHNLQQIRKMLGNNVKICAVMKADAYGHGINNLIDMTIKENVDYIAAIDNKEFKIMAKKIKASGKNIHLLRIAPVTETELVEAITNDYKVEEVAGSVREAQMLSDTAARLSKKLHKNIVVNIHLYIETGMGRMGVRKVSDMKQIIAMPHLKLVGVMTHLAKSYQEPPVDSQSVKEQLGIFESALAELNLNQPVIRHVANSGAAAKFPWARLDMVRIGSLIYGEDLDDLQDPNHVLKPVMKSFKSKVSIIESNVPPHSPINYDALQYTRDDKPSTTATLRIGYDYGFPQYAFQESTMVLIRGQKFPVIGKSSMNMVVIDITNEDPNNKVLLGDDAVIVGRQGKEEITWDEFAKWNKMGITETVLKIGNQNTRKVISN